MFRFLLELSQIYQVLRFIPGVVLSFLLLGVPILWALLQRHRLLALARNAGWKPARNTGPGEAGRMHKRLHGLNIDVWPAAPFGAKVFANFSTIKAIELKQRGEADKSLRKMRDFETSNRDFDAMFSLRRGRKIEIEGLKANHEALEALVALRRRWMFSISSLEISRHYIAVYLNFGTPAAYYLPPRHLEPLTSELAEVAAMFDSALGTHGQKLSK